MQNTLLFACGHEDIYFYVKDVPQDGLKHHEITCLAYAARWLFSYFL